jgi:hypothetical protein
MNIAEATAQLRAAKLATNEEVVRRWCREGKLPATRESRRAGWQIAETDLRTYIAAHAKPETHDYQQGYKDGRESLEQQLTELTEALRETLKNGGYVHREVITRMDLRNKISQSIHVHSGHQEELNQRMEIADQLFFNKPYTRTRRTTISARFAVNYIAINGSTYTDNETHLKYDYQFRALTAMRKAVEAAYEEIHGAD